MKTFLAALLILFCLSSCKKSKPETITFDYAYPSISFQVGDSANYGSTAEGWHYIIVERILNKEFLNTLGEKKILSEDVSDARLKSCVITMTSSDSSFNMFDSVQVKIGGTFTYQGQAFISGTPDLLIASLAPVAKTGLKTIDVTSLNENCNQQIRVDPNVGLRLKLYSAIPTAYFFPYINMKVDMVFSVTGTTH